VAAGVVVAGLAFYACSSARAQRAPAPAFTPSPGETTHPLPMTTGTPLAITGHAAAPRSDVRLPGTFISLAADTAFVETNDDRLHAVDLTTGHDRWTMAMKPPWVPLTASADRVFVTGSTWPQRPSVLVVDLRTGRTVATLAGAQQEGRVLGGTFYTKTDRGFAAYDAASGSARWVSAGGGQGLEGSPMQVGRLLLQDFADSGAILHDDLYAFDVRTGDARYVVGGAHIEGMAPRVIYVEDTWMHGDYRALALSTVRIADGAKLHEFDYAPDPAQHLPLYTGMWTGENIAAANGFVYFTLADTQYRYVADRDPADANPSRIEGIKIPTVFTGDAVLVSAPSYVAVARSLPDHLELHGLANSPLRAPVAHRPDGTRLIVAGDTLFALSPAGDAAHALGHVTCPDPNNVFAWLRHVAVQCGSTDKGAPQRILVYADDVVALATPEPLATPAIAAPPHFTAKLIVHPLDAPTTYPPQWDVAAIAAAPDGSVVVALQHTGAGPVTATFRRIAPDGTATDIPLPTDAAPYGPPSLIADATGRLWYTDRANPGLVRSYDAHDGARTYAIAPNDNSVPIVPDGTPYQQRPRRFPRSIPVRIALGPDGAIWFARSHPKPELGHVTGGSTYAIPTKDGSAFELIATKNALWYLTPTAVGRMTPDGTFSSHPLPEPFLQRIYAYPQTFIVPGPNDTIWLIGHATLAQLDATHIIRTLTLANATVSITTATTACDGTLYAGETTQQLARIDNHGLTEFPVETAWIEPKLHDTRCHLWYTNPYTLRNQGLGELQITPTH
jgi:outer membrane protein assembly factor BamB